MRKISLKGTETIAARQWLHTLAYMQMMYFMF